MNSDTRSSQPARVPQAEIPSVYARVASVYDVWSWLTESRARRRCIALAEVCDGEDVLEVAVGTGQTFIELARRNPNGRTAGVDLTPAMLARARRRLERAGLRGTLDLGDAHHLAFGDASFDLLVNNFMFDLLPESAFGAVLGEFRRVLRPGGRLVLVNMARGRYWYERFYEGLYHVRPSLMGGCRGVELRADVEAAGFTGVSRDYLVQFGFPSEILVARRPA